MWSCGKITRRLKRTYLIFPLLCIPFLILLLRDRSGKRERLDTVYDLGEWIKTQTVGCQGHFVGYAHQFVWLKNARYEGNETFAIPCDGQIPDYYFLFDEESPLGFWLSRLRKYPVREMTSAGTSSKLTPTFVFKRIEAHNLYHTLCEWYNVFMISKLLKMEPRKVDILFLDDRPESLLDTTWDVLFGHVTRYRAIPQNTLYETLIWSVIGYNSPLNYHHLHKVPYIEEFYTFFLDSYGVPRSRALDCSKIRVTVIWRRDYMTHPERKNLTNGLVHRKFKNEDEILKTLASVFAGDFIRPIIMEQMSMKQQLDVISDTDVLVGMHGAGMTHSLFLPKHAVVLEFFPNYWGFLRHFKMFSKWRGVKYIGWQNLDPRNEYADFYTRIPVDVVKEKAIEARRKIC